MMKTIILPGFSEHNKDWVDELEKSLNLSHQVIGVNWEHWKAKGGLKIKMEMEKIKKIVGKDDFNIIAKSVGTMVALKALETYKDKVNKIILCGIPSISEKRIDLFKNSIKDFNTKNIICFQNSFDPFVSFKNLEKELIKINKNIKMIEKPFRNHDYYYIKDFINFLQ